MITTTEMYWLTRLDSVKELLGHGLGPCFMGFTLLMAVATVLAFCLGTLTGNGAYEIFEHKSDEELKVIHTWLRRVSWRGAALGCVTFAMAVTCSVLETFVPTTREMAAIVMVPAIVNNEKVQTVGNKLYDLAAEWLDELKPKKEAKK